MPRPLTVFDSYHSETDQTDFLEQYMYVQIYLGEKIIFDDAIHFYYQTLRYDCEAGGQIWKEWANEMIHHHRNIAARSLRDAPWDLVNVNSGEYNVLTKQFVPVLPEKIASGQYLEGMTFGLSDWSQMNLVAMFENIYIRINAFYLD